MLMPRFTLVSRGALILGAELCGLVIAPHAAAQATPPVRSASAPSPAPSPASRPVTPVIREVVARPGDAEGELDPEDMPAVRQMLDDAAQHRSRLARIHRLRDLA